MTRLLREALGTLDDDRWLSCGAVLALQATRERLGRLKLPLRHTSTREIGWRRSPDRADEVCGVYTFRADRQTHRVALPHALFVPRAVFHLYHAVMPLQVRELISRERNCEDVALNFLVSALNADGRVYDTLDAGM
ncbi:MAG: hypothetical protein MHM6MM_003336 [Cercozoa sp. M6MM]